VTDTAADGRARSLIAGLVDFGAVLRAAGVRVAPGRLVEAAAGLGAVDVCDYHEFFYALRCTIPQSPAELARFDAAFDRFWRARFNLEAPPGRDEGPSGLAGVAGEATGTEVGEETVPGEAGRSEAEGAPLAWPVDELTMAGVARDVAEALSWRPSRRFRPSRRGPVLDPRRTMRHSHGQGGVPFVLARRERRRRKARVVVICDVSRSMEPFVRLLLRFTVELGAASARVEAFVFSMHLARITPALRRRSVTEGLRAIGRVSGDWKAGTRIGASLSEFMRRYSALLDRQTAVLILSDGLDTDDPAMIGASLREMRRLAGAVVWLNPLAASTAFEPRTRAMQAALPHLDLLASGHSVEGLAEVAARLRDLRGRRAASSCFT
jgi:uncharacterized protein with von Willebrand factor type A (vWA) domain